MPSSVFFYFCHLCTVNVQLKHFARFGAEDLVSGIQNLFNTVQMMQKSVTTVLNDPQNVFDDDDVLCRVVPQLLEACIEELGDMLKSCQVMEQNFKEFLAWIHPPESMKSAKAQDILMLFQTLIKWIRECNERNDALWYEDAVSVDSTVSAATVLSAQDRQINVVATEQVNDDSLEEFLAQSAKRIGV